MPFCLNEYLLASRRDFGAGTKAINPCFTPPDCTHAVVCTAIANYPQHLTNEKKLAPSSIIIALAALRFFYKITLRKDWCLEEVIPTPKKACLAFCCSRVARLVSEPRPQKLRPSQRWIPKETLWFPFFGSVSGFARFTLRVRARESLTGIHLLLSSQHSSRASPKRTYLPECPEEHSLPAI